MIASVHGVLEGIRENSLVLRVGGVGVEIFVPMGVLAGMGALGQKVDLYTHLVVREDALALYGFLLEEELTVFRMLLGVSGIGPRLALATLSALSPELLANAIHRDEAEVIARVPGVGKKTAQKIVLELKGKLVPETLPPGLAAVSKLDTEVIEALTALGYSVVEAQAALQSIPPDTPEDIEERVRLALGYFGG